jgi:hypothetical protein
VIGGSVLTTMRTKMSGKLPRLSANSPAASKRSGDGVDRRARVGLRGQEGLITSRQNDGQQRRAPCVHRNRDGVRTSHDPRAKWIFWATGAATAVVVAVALAMLDAGDATSATAAHAASRPVEAASPRRDVPARRLEQRDRSRPRSCAHGVRAVHVDRVPHRRDRARRKRRFRGPSAAARVARTRRHSLRWWLAGEKEGIAAFPPPAPIRRRAASS